ncbi:hypothetical protein [Pontiella sulfatireligans]|uniref:Cupin 2 conserved barrel domain-containing protein n=1 Tax=Pontiella sulfatireligans TaxID=2750658 RepID=A0A6C2UM87_9BACT|nr:hypothetical protein [Pontiella sulfatireligans]VGO21390.1 hypothetical protein SCARR_03463 [Pontiella sulfatireligans]
MKGISQKPKNVAVKRFPESGSFPNNGKLPLVVFQQALKLPAGGGPDQIDALVKANRWGGTWRWGLYTYHHYHSTAHECLCIFRGSVRVQFGGPKGTILEAAAGDVVILPAGLAHKNVGCSSDFQTLGCCPAGQAPDMQYGKPGERPATDQVIAHVPLPLLDPIFGQGGPLAEAWS